MPFACFVDMCLNQNSQISPVMLSQRFSSIFAALRAVLVLALYSLI